MVRTALLALLLSVGGGVLYLGSFPDLVSALWNAEKAGNVLDPDGATTDAGGRFDPNGATADAGNHFDPNG
jgi:hypothetical protein